MMRRLLARLLRRKRPQPTKLHGWTVTHDGDGWRARQARLEQERGRSKWARYWRLPD